MEKYIFLIITMTKNIKISKIIEKVPFIKIVKKP